MRDRASIADETDGTAGELAADAADGAPAGADPVRQALSDRKTVDLSPDGGGRGGSGPGVFDLDRFNQVYAMVIIGGRVAILEENWRVLGRDATPPQERVRFMTPEAFERWHANDLFTVEDKTWTAAQLWLRDPRRRQYRGIVFDPSQPPGGESGSYFNLWQGWSVEPNPRASCAIFLDHLRTNVANGNEGHAAFILGTLADMVQNPADRKGVALVLRGKMGSGKTIVGQHVGRLMEAHYALVDDPRHIVGNFNAHMASLLLLQADEGFWAGDKQAEGRLKGLVTSDRQMIEFKGKDAIQVRNYVHLLVTSNSDWVVPAGHDERRFAIFDVGDASLQNYEYFGEMARELAAGGYGRLLHELLTFDLRPIDLRSLPTTAALFEQKIASLPPVEAWWYTCLQRGWIAGGGKRDGGDIPADEEFEVWPAEIAIDRVYRSYLHFCDQVGMRHRKSSPQLGTDLRRLVKGLRRGRATIAHDGGRPYVYWLPSLGDCRAAFEALIRTPLDWETGQIDAERSTMSTDPASP